MTIDPHDIIPSDGSEPQQVPDFEDFELPGGNPEAPAGMSGLEAVHDVPVKVQAVLGRARMPIGDLLNLTSGTVLELDRRVGEPVDIFVNDRLIARGEVVLIDNALGVTLTEIVRADR
ncbi:flagellar motor switch protein FliN [Sphingomonas sp. HT-1]|jgi:flagellar motor switch protein FliN/FliY|uniref:flagellar motor switch protein FliN n=1 Tax=unclassified Sphingomonas TaxID=196159 RepID=UPI0002F444F4|nr:MULTISPECIES: flagellar motor switch protein FliN [unclassified Sphingomonas]KTF70595.1 flagellar motor switch protein FliN [Sphingomonas sp. WG]